MGDEERKDQNPAPTDQEDPNEFKPFAPNVVALTATFFVGKAIFATWGVLTIIALVLGIVSFLFAPESYWQHLCIEMCSGITAFLLTPLVVSWSRKTPILVRCVLGIASIGCAVLGFYQEGAIRLFSIEWTVMFGFLLGLELIFRKWFDDVNEMLNLGERPQE